MAAFDLLSETKACDLLARLFRARGYAVVRNIPFREYGISFHIDGWDAKARVGFEFLSSEDEDHDDLTLAEYQTLMAAQLRGELAVFIVDEVEPLSAADLRAAAEEFLDEVAAVVRARRKPAKQAVRATKPLPAAGKAKARPAAKGMIKKAAGKRAAKKAAASSSQGKQPAGTRAAARTGANKTGAKPAGGKRTAAAKRNRGI